MGNKTGPLESFGVLHVRGQVYHRPTLESCDDPPHAADGGRCGDGQDEYTVMHPEPKRPLREEEEGPSAQEAGRLPDDDRNSID